MRVGVVLLALLLTACSATGARQSPSTANSAQFKPKEISVSGPYRHKYWGLSFPETVGPFTRSNVLQFDAESADVGANYQTPDGKTFATVYLYPIVGPIASIPSDYSVTKTESDRKCAEFFDGAKDLALRQYQNSIVREEGPFSLPSRPDYAGHRLVFDADHRIAAPGYPSALKESDGPLTSELYLFCQAGTYWHLKYRFTYPQGVAAGVMVTELLNGVPAP